MTRLKKREQEPCHGMQLGPICCAGSRLRYFCFDESEFSPSAFCAAGKNAGYAWEPVSPERLLEYRRESSGFDPLTRFFGLGLPVKVGRSGKEGLAPENRSRQVRFLRPLAALGSAFSPTRIGPRFMVQQIMMVYLGEESYKLVRLLQSHLSRFEGAEVLDLGAARECCPSRRAHWRPGCWESSFRLKPCAWPGRTRFPRISAMSISGARRSERRRPTMQPMAETGKSRFLIRPWRFRPKVTRVRIGTVEGWESKFRFSLSISPPVTSSAAERSFALRQTPLCEETRIF